LAGKELENNSNNSLVRAHFAYMLARLEERKRAESQAVLAAPPGAALSDRVARWVVLTYVVLGEHDRAIDVVEHLPDEVIKSLNRLSGLAELQRDPRFQELMQFRHIQ
jgi:hypothetical protein